MNLLGFPAGHCTIYIICFSQAVKDRFFQNSREAIAAGKSSCWLGTRSLTRRAVLQFSDLNSLHSAPVSSEMSEKFSTVTCQVHDLSAFLSGWIGFRGNLPRQVSIDDARKIMENQLTETSQLFFCTKKSLPWNNCRINNWLARKTILQKIHKLAWESVVRQRHSYSNVSWC